MKKIILLCLILLAFACKEPDQKAYLKTDKTAPITKIKKKNYKIYRKGDVVYIRPDSLKVTIIYENTSDPDDLSYDVKFFVAGEEVRVNYIKPHSFY